ncbi:MAG: ATP-binding cassette domain-containing protein [Chloroflexi bacterium]|nr:ATP-binding cassette domain-containing protein [Chloroflexota bacterium]
MPVQPIVVDNATKVYGPIVAVDHLSFEISEGSVLALLGPNGAGKTTLIKILTTVAHASSGTAFIEGHDVRTERKTVRRLIGVVPQINNFDRFLTGRENLVLHAKMHGMPRSVYDRRIDELLEMVGLDKRQHDTPDKYSGGMQRRLIIARALVHQPRILFLDEPTTGLDPQSRRAVWDYVENLHGKATIMLTTHDMEEADQLSDRVIIMDNGRTLADGTSSELKQSIGVRAQYEIR